MDVSYREIAKVLAFGMPLDGQDYRVKIESYIKSIEAMPVEQQATLQASFIFSRKAPREERRDLFQHLTAHILELMATWPKAIRDKHAWCYVVARNEWKRITRERKRHTRMINGGFVSLNEPVKRSESQETELQELIAGEVEFERKLNSELDSQSLLYTLTDNIKAIIDKRLNREKLSSHEYEKLARYREANGETIREALAV